MKRHTHLVALAVGLLMGLGGPAAAAGQGVLSARIPFDFSAGEASLGAGTYTVDRQSSGVIMVRGHRNGAFLWSEGAVSTANDGAPTRLVFHRYGDRYFLRQVWFHGARGYALPQTRAEREVASRRGKVAAAPVVVVVATHG